MKRKNSDKIQPHLALYDNFAVDTLIPYKIYLVKEDEKDLEDLCSKLHINK